MHVVREPVPALRYHERYLIGADRLSGRGPDDAGVMLLGWSDGPLRWMSWRDDRPGGGDIAPERRLAALQAMIDFIRDPRGSEQDALCDVARLPAWQFALGALDDRLSRLTSASARGAGSARGDERIAFRVIAFSDGAVRVEPVVQKRARNGAYSPGKRLPWYKVPDHPARSAADERVYRAYDDPLARRSAVWGGALTHAQTFGVLRALIDHPAVFLDGAGSAGRRGAERLDIRQGRLRLRFAGGRDGALTPQLELVGVTLLPPEVAAALRDDRHVVILHGRDDDDVGDGGAPRVLLAEVSPEAAAIVRALALAPVSFPPEAHDALAARLEPLQESVDIELPAQWTRTIGPADARLIVRLELLASGALEVRLGVRPAKLGPVFRPGEGPALLLEGQGRDRHGVRRDRAEEQRAARALAEQLGLVASWAEVASPAQQAAVTRGGEPERCRQRTGRRRGGDRALVLARWRRRSRVARRRDAEGPVGRRRRGGPGRVGRRRAARRLRHDRAARPPHEGGRSARLVRRRGRREDQEGARRGSGAARRSARGDSRGAALPAGRRARLRAHRAGAARGAGARRGGDLRGTRRRTAAVRCGSRGWRAIRWSGWSRRSRRSKRRRRSGRCAAAWPPVRPIVPRVGAELEAALRPYQRAGVEWLARLAHWGAGAILADEMGLGKTVQTLAVLVDRAALGPALVVAPTSVVGNWVDEAARFAPSLRVRLYRGPDRAAELRGLGAGDVLVTSYAIATLDAERLGEIEFASLVLDEAQAVKNATTERSRALRGLQAAWRVGLTGTPIENHLGEIWSLMRVICPGLLGTWEQFRGRFAVPIEKFGDDARRRALAALLRPFILRRTKADVAPELPARTDVVRSVRLSDGRDGAVRGAAPLDARGDRADQVDAGGATARICASCCWRR